MERHSTMVYVRNLFKFRCVLTVNLLRYSDQRRSYDTFAQHISILDNADNGTAFRAVSWLMRDRFMKVRVKLSAQGFNSFDALALQHILKFACDELDAIR